MGEERAAGKEERVFQAEGLSWGLGTKYKRSGSEREYAGDLGEDEHAMFLTDFQQGYPGSSAGKSPTIQET